MIWLTTSPVVLGYVPVAIVFGLMVKQSHFSVWFALGCSVFIFAGASQFLVLSLLPLSSSSFLSFLPLISSVGLLNLRHFFLSLGYLPLTRKWTWLEKLRFYPLLTDETFAVLSNAQEFGEDPLFSWHVSLIHYGAWIFGTGVGYLLGDLIQSPQRWGLDFVLTGLLVGILFLLTKNKTQVVSLAATVVLCTLTILLFGNEPNGLLVSALAGSFIGTYWGTLWKA